MLAGYIGSMKRLLVLMLLTGWAGAEPVGYSPTMPFGIQAHSTQAPVNTGAHMPTYNPYGYYYYYSGGAASYSTGSHRPSASQSVPGYDTPLKSGSLPGYDRPRQGSTLPGYSSRSR